MTTTEKKEDLIDRCCIWCYSKKIYKIKDFPLMRTKNDNDFGLLRQESIEVLKEENILDLNGTLTLEGYWRGYMLSKEKRYINE